MLPSVPTVRSLCSFWLEGKEREGGNGKKKCSEMEGEEAMRGEVRRECRRMRKGENIKGELITTYLEE